MCRQVTSSEFSVPYPASPLLGFLLPFPHLSPACSPLHHHHRRRAVRTPPGIFWHLSSHDEVSFIVGHGKAMLGSKIVASFAQL